MDPAVAFVAILIRIASFSHTVGILFFIDCSVQLSLIAYFVCMHKKQNVRFIFFKKNFDSGLLNTQNKKYGDDYNNYILICIGQPL